MSATPCAIMLPAPPGKRSHPVHHGRCPRGVQHLWHLQYPALLPAADLAYPTINIRLLPNAPQ